MQAYERGFVGGILAGVAALGVTVLVIGAVRRAQARRVTGTPIGIDSIPPEPVALSVQPAPETNANEGRLASEMDDVMLPSQRW